jgi:MFS family permease
MTGPGTALDSGQGLGRRLLWVLSAATFLIFFQAFMVAPLIPTLGEDLGVSPQRIGLVVPAYMVAYGVATLVYGVSSDRWGRRRLMVGSLVAFVVLTAATATAQTATQLIAWRLATGLGAAAVVPLALSLIGAVYPFQERGRPLGWLFAAMAGGMAFGFSLGALAEPFLVGSRAGAVSRQGQPRVGRAALPILTVGGTARRAAEEGLPAVVVVAGRPGRSRRQSAWASLHLPVRVRRSTAASTGPVDASALVTAAAGGRSLRRPPHYEAAVRPDRSPRVWSCCRVSGRSPRRRA